MLTGFDTALVRDGHAAYFDASTVPSLERWGRPALPWSRPANRSHRHALTRVPAPCLTHISDSKRFVWLQAEVVGPAVTLGIVADQALPDYAVQRCRQTQFDVFAREIVDDNQLLATQAAPVGE